MAKEYTIPQILNIAGIRGYTPRLSGGVNQLLSAKTDIEYNAALKTATIEISGFENIELFDDENLEGYSDKNHFEGLSIFMPLLFEKIEGTNDDLYLESAIISFNRQKNIQKTITQGRDTSVKEFINNGDYSISISGLICNKGVGYPKQNVSELKLFLNAKLMIPIVHEVLNMFGIYNIVITDYSIPPSPFTNGQPYTINAINEEPAELIEK